MRYLLNIGSRPSGRVTSSTEELTRDRIIRTLFGAGFDVRAVRVFGNPAEERTFVVEARLNLTEDYLAPFTVEAFVRSRIASAAFQLEQEAIAVVPLITGKGVDTTKGFLAGPFAELWGSFDPTLFLDLSGRPLVSAA